MRYGCHNSKREPGYYARSQTIVMDDREQPAGLVLDQIVEFVEDTLSKECRYDQRAADAKCVGCVK